MRIVTLNLYNRLKSTSPFNSANMSENELIKNNLLSTSYNRRIKRLNLQKTRKKTGMLFRTTGHRYQLIIDKKTNRKKYIEHFK